MINFPNTPTIDQEHQVNNTTWRWNGIGWLKLGEQGPQGPQGPQGEPGVSGVSVIKKTSITLLDTGWTLDTGLYKYTYSDGDIVSTSIVDVIPRNSTIDIVIAAEMLPQVDTATGSVTIWCKNEPTDDISININIWN